MKISLVILSALISLSALASPRVGDTVTFSGTTAQGAAVTALLKISSFNASTGTYRVHSELTVASQPDVSDEDVKASEMFTEEVGAAFVANCSSYGGTLETMTTVPTGAIQTCKIPSSPTDMVWIGAIPFGIVKLRQAAPYAFDITVNSITRGP